MSVKNTKSRAHPHPHPSPSPSPSPNPSTHDEGEEDEEQGREEAVRAVELVVVEDSEHELGDIGRCREM